MINSSGYLASDDDNRDSSKAPIVLLLLNERKIPATRAMQNPY